MVRIRMSRLGRPHRPFYRINAVDSRVKRDGSVIENLGWYNPMAKGDEKAMDLNIERIKHWISVGAQPSETVRDMLARNGVIDAARVKAEHEKKVAARKAAAEKKAANAPAEKKDEKKG